MKLIVPIALSALLIGCAAQPSDPYASADRNNTAIGAIIGAVAGAVVGGQLDDDGNRDKGTILGAIAGAAAGAGIGNMMDKQEQEFRQQTKDFGALSTWNPGFRGAKDQI